jgi:hypothetical protein
VVVLLASPILYCTGYRYCRAPPGMDRPWITPSNAEINWAPAVLRAIGFPTVPVQRTVPVPYMPRVCVCIYIYIYMCV